jgi:hypothetical protein
VSKQFIAELNAWAKDNLQALPVDVMKRVCIDVMRGLVLNTPVGNEQNWAISKRIPGYKKPGYVGGHMRRNWQAQIGAPLRQELPGVDATGTQAIDQMSRAIAGITEPTIIYFSNPVPYAEVVEFGSGTKKPWSIQAPEGVVTPTLRDVETKYRKIL